MDSRDATSRFDIDPRDYKKDSAYVGCFSLWSIGIVGLGILFIFYKFWVGVVFAGVFSLIIPFAIFRRNDVQSLLVDEEGLLLVKNHTAGSGVRISRRALIELTLEHVESGGDVERESVSTLNLWESEHGYRRRHILGLWISESSRGSIFQRLHHFLEDAQFDVEAVNKLADANKSVK